MNNFPPPPEDGASDDEFYAYAEQIILECLDVYEEFRQDNFAAREIQKRLDLHFNITISDESAETLASIFSEIQEKEINLAAKVTTLIDRAAQRNGTTEEDLIHFIRTGERLP